MNGFEMWQMIVGSGGILGIAVGVIFLVFRTGRIVQKIETIDSTLKEFKNEVNEELRDVRQEIKQESRILRQEMKEESLKVREEIKSEIAFVRGDVISLKDTIKDIQKDVSDIKERVSFMETFMFFSEFKADNPTSRSETMREVWKKRRMKQVQVKDK